MQCVCLTNFTWCSTSNSRCHVTSSNTKMNINWHLHFFSKMSFQCHMSSSTCHFNFQSDNWLVVFSFTSHTTCPNLNCACQWHTFIFCASFYVSNIKNLQKLCQKYTLLGWSQPIMPKNLPDYWFGPFPMPCAEWLAHFMATCYSVWEWDLDSLCASPLQGAALFCLISVG